MANRNRVTIKHIAEKVGVSYATASLALSGKGRLSEATRKKILDIASTLGYSVDERPVSNIPLIAFVDASSHMGGFYMSLIEGVIDKLKEYNYAVIRLYNFLRGI